MHFAFCPYTCKDVMDQYMQYLQSYKNKQDQHQLLHEWFRFFKNIVAGLPDLS